MPLLEAPNVQSKPKLRGVSHAGAFVVALFSGAGLVIAAPGRTAKVACGVYAASLCLLLGISALYHLVNWSGPGVRQRMRRLDHSAIFVLIAGTYTPFAFTLDSPATFRLLVVAWAGAAIGVLKALFWVDGPKWLVALLAVAVGWLALIYAGPLKEKIGVGPSLLLAAGGLFYSVGAVVYALKRPDPWPATFGYHEVFHALVIVAAGCHFVAVSSSLKVMA